MSSLFITGIEIAAYKKLFITEVRLHGKQHCKMYIEHKGVNRRAGQTGDIPFSGATCGEIEKNCSSKKLQLDRFLRTRVIAERKANEDEMSIERDGLFDVACFTERK